MEDVGDIGYCGCEVEAGAEDVECGGWGHVGVVGCDVVSDMFKVMASRPDVICWLRG